MRNFGGVPSAGSHGGSRNFGGVPSGSHGGAHRDPMLKSQKLGGSNVPIPKVGGSGPPQPVRWLRLWPCPYVCVRLCGRVSILAVSMPMSLIAFMSVSAAVYVFVAVFVSLLASVSADVIDRSITQKTKERASQTFLTGFLFTRAFF